MFQVGIEEVERKLSSIRAEYDSFAEKYKNGITIKLKLDEVESLTNSLSKIGNPKALQPYVDEIERLKKLLENAKNSIEALTNTSGKSSGKNPLVTELKNADELESRYRRLRDVYSSLNQLRHRAVAADIDVSPIESKMRSILEFIRKIRELQQGSLMDKNLLKTATFDDKLIFGKVNTAEYFTSLRNEIRALVKEYDVLIQKRKDASATTPSGGLQKGSLANTIRENGETASREVDKQKNIIKKKMLELRDTLTTLMANRRQGGAFGLTMPDISKYINQYRQLYRVLSESSKTGIVSSSQIASVETLIGVLKSLNSEQRKSNVEFARGTKKKDTTETNENTSAKTRNSEATRRLAMEERELAGAIQKGISAAHHQSQVLNDLKSLATQYLGVWGAQQFLNNIIQIGGQLEMQRKSLGAILGDLSQGNSLFDDVKQLALRSPFGVVELDQYSKQLSAYGFKYNELFDMTKRLSDIAAGAGTDVGRLALALGHVRSEGALSGYTLRQFAMNNIPMLQKLSERLTEVEGKIVSTSEIRKRVSKKEIGYEDVIAVIKEMTDEGGMFFNMQETMADTVKAKFKNLKDSMDIMYGDMAKSSFIGGSLKSIATALTNITREWKVMLSVLATSAAYFATNRLAMIGLNTQAAKYSVNLSVLGRQTFKLTAEEVSNLAATQKLTRTQLLAAVATRRLSVDQAVLAGEYHNLTRAQLEEIAVSGRLNRALLGNALATSKYSVAQLRAMATARGHTGFRFLDRAIGSISLGWKGATKALSGFIAGLRSLAASMGWLIALQLVIGKIVSQYSKLSEERDRMANTKEKGVEGYRNLSESSANFKIGASVELDESGLRTQIDNMVQELKEYSPQVGNTLKEAFAVGKNGANIHSLAEQYELLAKEIDATKDAYKKLQDISDVFEKTNDKTGGRWYQFAMNDSLRKNITDYSEVLEDQKDAEDKFLQNRARIDEKLEATRKIYKIFNAEVERNIKLYKESKGKEGFDESDTMAQVKLLEKYRDAFNEKNWKTPEQRHEIIAGRQAYDYFGINISNLTSSWQTYLDVQEKVSDSYSRMKSDGDKYSKELVEVLQNRFGKTIDKFNDAEKRAVQIGLQTFLNGINGFKDMAAEKRQEIEQMLLNPFNIKVDAEVEEAYQKMSELQSYLESITSKQWTVKINTIQTFEGLIKSTQEAHKTNTDTMKRLRQSVKDFGYDPDVVGSNVFDLKTALAKETRANAKRAVEEYWNAAMSEATNKLVAQENHFSLIDNTPGGKTIKPTKTKATKDEELESWRKRIQLLDKYRSELDQLTKLIGRQEAEGKLKADGNFSPLWSYFGNPNDYMNSIDEVVKKLGTKGDRKNFVEELGAKKAEEELRRFKESISDTVSELGRMLDIMSENYNTYKKWVDLTGDKTLAAQISGVTENSSYADYLKGEFAKQGGAGTGMAAESFFGLSESEAKKFGENSGLYKLWDEWQKNNKKIKSDNLKLFEEAIKNAKGYKENVADINRELENTIEAIKAMTGGSNPTPEQQNERNILINNANQNAQKKIADLTWKNFKETEDWGRVFGDLDRLSTGTLTHLLAKLKQVAPTLDGSVESTKAAYEAIEKVEKVVNGRNPFRTIVNSLSRQKTLRGYYNQAKKSGDLVANDELSQLLGVKRDSKVSKAQIKDGLENETENFEDAIDKVIDGLQTFQNSLNLLSNVFDSLGMTGASNIASDAAGILGGALGGAQALSSLGPWGMAAGAALGLIGGIAQAHDKGLERKIESLRQDVQKIDNTLNLIKSLRERSLGYDNGNMRRQLARMYAGQKGDSAQAMYEYYTRGGLAGNGYTQELNALKKQRQDYQDMYDAENDKKKKSKESLEEYKVKMAELDEQILNFTQDLANELWSIDIKGWADQIGDALMTAFENGTSMAEAYRDAVTDIMQDVVSQMLKVGILEPMFENLRKKLFGYTDDSGNKHEGVFDIENPGDSAKKTAQTIAEWFGEGGEGTKTITAANEYLTQMEKMLGERGMTLKSKSGTTAAKSVQNTITEETGGMLYGVFNATRQDTSVIRIVAEQFINSYWPSYMESVTKGTQSLGNIESHTSAIMRMMNEGQGAMYEQIYAMRRKMDDFTQPDGRLRVN